MVDDYKEHPLVKYLRGYIISPISRDLRLWVRKGKQNLKFTAYNLQLTSMTVVKYFQMKSRKIKLKKISFRSNIE